jgi:urea carboxylase
MKMECPFEAPASGTVEALYTAQGQSLAPGAPMFALRRAS